MPVKDDSEQQQGKANKMKIVQSDVFGHPKDGKLRCGFCYPHEQFTHGEVKREWFTEFNQFVPLCRKHSAEANAPYKPDEISND